MIRTLGLVTDRLLSVLVPKTTASACACNDYFCTYSGCPGGHVRTCHSNCNCSKTTCGACFSGWC
jgi:hypothetical protein